MKNLFKRLPTFSADYSGVCNAIQHMRCLIILHGQGGCIGEVEKRQFFWNWKKIFQTGKKENRVNIIGDTCLSGWTEDRRTNLKSNLQRQYDKVISWNDNVGIEELQKMCSASINIVASVSALPTVRKLEEDYGVPYMIAEEELKEIKGMEVFNKTGSILLVGEQVIMNQYRKQFRKNGYTGRISVCNFFEMNLEWMEEGDCRLEGEDDYIKYLKEQGGYEYIVGDPLLEQVWGISKGIYKCTANCIEWKIIK